MEAVAVAHAALAAMVFRLVCFVAGWEEDAVLGFLALHAEELRRRQPTASPGFAQIGDIVDRLVAELLSAPETTRTERGR
jgi:hypothetical protein